MIVRDRVDPRIVGAHQVADVAQRLCRGSATAGHIGQQPLEKQLTWDDLLVLLAWTQGADCPPHLFPQQVGAIPKAGGKRISCLLEIESRAEPLGKSTSVEGLAETSGERLDIECFPVITAQITGPSCSGSTLSPRHRSRRICKR